MYRDDATFPFRQATRIINDFQHGIVGIFLDVAGRDLVRMVVLLMLYRAALRRAPERGEGRISMNAIATSLSASPETVRRHGHALAEAGFCRPGDRGMEIAADFLDRADVSIRGDRLLAWFTHLLDGFEATGFQLPPAVRAQSRNATLATALDLYLSVFELAEVRHRDWIDLYVMGAIVVHNAAGITHAPDLARRYGHADARPPISLRRPVSVTAIAAMHGFPYATIWRHTVKLRRAGAIELRDGGYLMSESWLFGDEIDRLSQIKVRYARRVLADLANGRAGCGGVPPRPDAGQAAME